MATILMIENDAAFYHSLHQLLGERGHQVLHACNGFDGIQQADAHPIDLVVLDVDLPDMDGKGVAAALRTRPRLRQVPIVALTGPDDPITFSLVEAFGCNGCISKSTDIRMVPQRVMTYLEQFAF